MSNEDLQKELSPENAKVDPESEEMKIEETQQAAGGAGHAPELNDDVSVRRPMPKPEDYDFFLNVRRNAKKDDDENDEPTEH